MKQLVRLVFTALLSYAAATDAAAQYPSPSPTPKATALPTASPTPKPTQTTTPAPIQTPTQTPRPTPVATTACQAITTLTSEVSADVAGLAFEQTTAAAYLIGSGEADVVDEELSSYLSLDDESLCATALGYRWVMLLTSGREIRPPFPLEDPFRGLGPPGWQNPLPPPSFGEQINDWLQEIIREISRFPRRLEWHMRQLADELRRRGILR